MWLLYAITVLAGIANAIEPGQNATLGKMLGNPMLSGLVCFALGVLLFAIALPFVQRSETSGEPSPARPPWWAWTGGILGAVVVLAQLYVSEQIGAAPFLGCVVTVGVVGSVILDHYGLVGFEPHRSSRWRVCGSLLMIAGVVLVVLF